MVELLKSKSMIAVAVLVLGVSFISVNNQTTLDNNTDNQIQVNA